VDFTPIMKLLFLSFLAVAAIRLNWTHPTNQLSDDLQFIITTNGDLSVPVSQWAPLAILSATNTLATGAGTNLDDTGTNYIYSTPFSLVPGQLFFIIRSSNLWTISSNSPMAAAPPVAGAPDKLSLHK
jgi:hypothetical protein